MSTSAYVPDMRNPTDVYDDVWIRAYHPDYASLAADLPKGYGLEYGEIAETSGKWMLFILVSDINSAWSVIRAETMAGKLGIEAKTATMMPNPRAINDDEKLICVYTRDYRDIEDVRKALIALRDLGFRDKISYKTDHATLSGKYGDKATLYTSQADTIQFGYTSEPPRYRRML